MVIKQELKPEDVNNIIATALEGGINYWCRKAKMKLAYPDNPDNKYFGVAPEFEDKIRYASDLIGYGGVIILYDAESSEKWELDLEKVLKGIKIHCSIKGVTPLELVEDHDADDADSIVQYALFNELVFC